MSYSPVVVRNEAIGYGSSGGQWNIRETESDDRLVFLLAGDAYKSAYFFSLNPDQVRYNVFRTIIIFMIIVNMDEHYLAVFFCRDPDTTIARYTEYVLKQVVKYIGHHKTVCIQWYILLNFVDNKTLLSYKSFQFDIDQRVYQFLQGELPCSG